MPNIQKIPDHLRFEPGVEMVPPPAEFFKLTNEMIADAIRAADVKGGETAVTWIATTEGVNAAVVARVNDDLHFLAYIGKKWGEPIEAGVAGRLTF